MSASMLEPRHLRLVRAVAEEGGPTRAAARLHLTQSAVSHQLAELEGRLGVALFTRLQLTAAGKRLLDFSRITLAELARIEQELHHAGTRKRETLRVSTECFTCYHWLPGVLPELRRDHPHVDVRIVVEATKKPVVALLKGEGGAAAARAPAVRAELRARRRPRRPAGLHARRVAA